MQGAHVERLVCQAQMRLAAALLAAGRLQPLLGPFNGEAQRFQQRFAFAQRLQRPEPLFFDQYARSVDVSSAPLPLLLFLCVFSTTCIAPLCSILDQDKDDD